MNDKKIRFKTLKKVYSEAKEGINGTYNFLLILFGMTLGIIIELFGDIIGKSIMWILGIVIIGVLIWFSGSIIMSIPIQFWLVIIVVLLILK